MNITDVEVNFTESEKAIFIEMIFKRQLELSHKYDAIERANGFWRPESYGSLDLDDYKVQNFIRQLIHFGNEEVLESLNANTEKDNTHALEEAIDALHFYTEALLVLGYQVSSSQCRGISSSFNSVEQLSALKMFFSSQGLALNCLKNKPWKSSPVKTNMMAFSFHLVIMYTSYVHYLLEFYKLSELELLTIYYKKSEINKFRQRSNY